MRITNAFSDNRFLRCCLVCGGLLLLLSRFAIADERQRLPSKIDLTADFERLGLTPLAQGNRDDCSLFAVTALAEFESARRATNPPPRLSEEFLIWASDRATRETGDQAMFYKAVDGLNALGICTADLMPYSGKPNPHRKPSREAIADAQPRRARWQVEWIKRWSLDSRISDGQLLEIKQALAKGHPVACGLRWPNTLNGYKLLDVPPPDEVSDGHSIAFVGYTDDTTHGGQGVLLFRNSFGANWGNKGYGVMSYAYARAYANDALRLNFGPPNSEVPTIRYEAESMAVVAKEKCDTSRQKMNDFGAAMWSHGEQLFCSTKRGGWAELRFDVPKGGRYRVRILATAAPDYGIVRAALDGRTLGPRFDLYSGRVCPAGSLELGTHDFSAGNHRLRVTAIGKNAVSKGFSFGLDAVDLIAAKSL
jgi:hypothetical protein